MIVVVCVYDVSTPKHKLHNVRIVVIQEILEVTVILVALVIDIPAAWVDDHAPAPLSLIHNTEPTRQYS